MDKLIIILVAVLILGILAKITTDQQKNKTIEIKYNKRILLTNAEKVFYNILTANLPQESILFAKVRLWDIIDVPKSTQNRIKYTNQIKSKHIDFLICDANLNPIKVIELDDKSHETQSRQKRDAFVDNALTTAGIDIIHMKAKKEYKTEDIMNIFPESNVTPTN